MTANTETALLSTTDVGAPRHVLLPLCVLVKMRKIGQDHLVDFGLPLSSHTRVTSNKSGRKGGTRRRYRSDQGLIKTSAKPYEIHFIVNCTF